MTRKEQKQFVNELSSNIAKDICDQIANGRVPENWDGHELRALLSYRHGLSGKMSDRKRLRGFNNTVIVNNL